MNKNMFSLFFIPHPPCRGGWKKERINLQNQKNPFWPPKTCQINFFHKMDPPQNHPKNWPDWQSQLDLIIYLGVIGISIFFRFFVILLCWIFGRYPTNTKMALIFLCLDLWTCFFVYSLLKYVCLRINH